jgi:hypothetical protein
MVCIGPDDGLYWRSRDRMGFLACEAGVSIKPGARAPGYVQIKGPEPA